MSSFLNGLQIKFLFCCFFMQTFPGPKCLKISVIAKLSVCLWFSSFFQVVGARANLGASSGASHFDAGPTVHSITILALRWLWRRVTLRSNWAITCSLLCFASEVVSHRVFLFGRSLSEPEELPSCLPDSGSDKDSSADIFGMDIHARYLSLSDWLMLVDSLRALALLFLFWKENEEQDLASGQQVTQS